MEGLRVSLLVGASLVGGPVVGLGGSLGLEGNGGTFEEAGGGTLLSFAFLLCRLAGLLGRI